MMQIKVVKIPPIQAMKLPMQAMKLPMQVMKLLALLTMQAMKLPAPTTTPPQDQMILMSMALACLLSLPLVFVYFLHVTLFLKNLSMKNRINHQKDVIYFSKIHTINE